MVCEFLVTPLVLQWIVDSGRRLVRRWRGVVLEGGVAGGIPPHKGGPKARPPKGKKRVKRSEE